MTHSDSPQPPPDAAIRYNACTTEGDKEYLWRSYKGYCWARKKCREKLSTCGSKADGWYIERQKTWYDRDGKFRSSAVIIAQGKTTIVKNRFRVIA